MPVTISGSGTITGIATGGLPDGSIASGDLADNAVTAGKLASSLDLTGKTVTLPSGTGGKIVNVAISSFYSTQESTSSTSYVDTSFTATYTPSSSSNKVLLIHQFQEGARRGYGHYYDIKRTVGATTTQLGSSYTQGIIGSYSAAADSNRLGQIIWLDSPATTSEITYRLIHRASSTGQLQYVYNNGMPAFWLFLEVAA